LITLGVACEEMNGDIVAAKKAFREAYELSETSPSISVVGNAPLPLIALAYLADYESIEGNLRNASRMYEQAIGLAQKWGGQSSLALCFVQQGRAGLLYEWNDLDGAVSALQECFRIGDLWKSPRLLVPAYGLSAVVMQARGQVEEANALIHRAEQLHLIRIRLPMTWGCWGFIKSLYGSRKMIFRPLRSGSRITIPGGVRKPDVCVMPLQSRSHERGSRAIIGRAMISPLGRHAR
jgi:tetratricopeptide (TPR) repeat protein